MKPGHFADALQAVIDEVRTALNTPQVGDDRG